MNPRFKSGSRVSVSATYHWARLATGTVCEPPEHVQNLAGDWQGLVREVASLQGPQLFQWVEFDIPQVDADGDGPYQGAEIDVRYLDAIVE